MQRVGQEQPQRIADHFEAKGAGDPGRRRLLEEARRAVRPFAGPQGILAPAEVLLGVGTKEARTQVKQEKEMNR